MKKGYSDPLMFSNVLLTGISIGPSQTGGFGPGGPSKSRSLNAVAPALSTPSDLEEGSAAGNEIQIVDPAQAVEKTITESDVQSVIEELSPAETATETPAENASDIAE